VTAQERRPTCLFAAKAHCWYRKLATAASEPSAEKSQESAQSRWGDRAAVRELKRDLSELLPGTHGIAFEAAARGIGYDR
jgi:hypothetical protein